MAESSDRTSPEVTTGTRVGRSALGFAAVVSVAVGACALFLGTSDEVPAQSAEVVPSAPTAFAAQSSVRLIVPSVLLAEPASETALPIDIAQIESMPRNCLLRIRGLPATASLSEGHAIGAGAWAVPIAAVSRLRVALPVGHTGKSEIAMSLVTVDGVVLAEARSALIVGAAKLIAPESPERAPSPASPPPAPRVAAAPPVEPAPTASAPASVPSAAPPLPATSTPVPAPETSKPEKPAAPDPVPAPSALRTPIEPPPVPAGSAAVALPNQASIPPEVRARAQSMHKRGEALRKDGDIASARLFYERASEDGLAEAALALGGTYDPYELTQARVQGLKPNPAAAKKWYEKARSLGSPEAEERLRRLAN